MKLYDYCDAINAQIEITRHANQDNRWTAQFRNAEIKEGKILGSSYGSGISPLNAVSKYLENIKGKRLVFNASGTDRREFDVPTSLEI